MSYPIMSGYLSDEPRVWRGQILLSDRANFLAMAKAVMKAAEEGTIANVLLISHKDYANRSIDKALSALRQAHIYGKKWNDLPDDVKVFNDTIGHTDSIAFVVGKHNRGGKLVAKMADPAPYVVAVMDLLTELLPLAAAFETFKGKDNPKVAKRGARDPEAEPTGYEPPPVGSEAEKKVVAMLEAVTQAEYIGLRDLFIRRFRDAQVRFLAAQVGEKRGPSPYKFFHPDFMGVASTVDKTVEQTSLAESGLEIYVSNRQEDKVFLAEATKIADMIRRAFVHKNFHKIASVIEAKGNFTSAITISQSVSLSGLEGTFLFNFEDGSNFTVINKVVFVVNQNGTAFNRYPLTFTEVMLPSGQRMVQPSEKRMNEVFVKATK